MSAVKLKRLEYSLMVILFSNNEIVVIKTQLTLKSANKFNDSKIFFCFSKRKIKDGCTFLL